jgi:hypothetical protein
MLAVPMRPIWVTVIPCLLMKRARMGEMMPLLKRWESWTASSSLREPVESSLKDYPSNPPSRL